MNHRFDRLRISIALLPLLAAGCHTAPRTPPDLILVNARIWRGPSERDLIDPTAVAIADNRIIAVGRDHRIRALARQHTRIIDVERRRIIPGLTDSHTHVVSGGQQLARLNLRETNNKDEFIRAIETDAKSKKSGQWVLGGRWSVESWRDSASPTKEWLDPVTGDTPVLLSRMDGHQALANSAALRIAGIDAQGPPDPPGGEIERDPRTGEPTGILKESAADLVEKHAPPPSEDELYEAFLRAMRHANSLGITSVHDMSELSHLDVFRRAHANSAMTLRVTSYLSVSDWAAHYDTVREFRVLESKHRVAGFKGYMDGSLGSRTAYMREPFADTTADSKYPRGQLNAMADPPEKFRQAIADAIAQGFQLAIHAIGDEGNHLALNHYESTSHRWRPAYVLPQSCLLKPVLPIFQRIEHAQHLLPSDIPRFAKIGVAASMQPFHKADDGRYAERILGRERLEGSYAFRQLLDAGALLCFGSDWPVVTLNPFAGIDAAVNAKTIAGDVWLPDHSITAEEALTAYTYSPAVAVRMQNELGSIGEGKLADLVVLDSDPLSRANRETLSETKVWMTIMDGNVVFHRVTAAPLE